MATKDFTTRANNLYAQLRQLGDEARQIITDFAKEQDGTYTLDPEIEDPVWINDDAHVTAIKMDGNGNVLVFNSAQYSEYLHDMDYYNILDLATYIVNL